MVRMLFLVRMGGLWPSRQIPFDFAGGAEQKGAATGRWRPMCSHPEPLQREGCQKGVKVVAASQTPE